MSKARVYGNLPEKIQERPFADQLSELDFGNHRVHVWYTRILGTRDVDALILVERVGIFVIEIKSISLSAIREINEDNGIVLNENVKSSTKKAPWHQAIDAAESFQGQIESATAYTSTLGGLWIAAGAALFRISRSKFRTRFGSEPRFRHASEALAFGMIFAEDLVDGESLLKRLEYIKQNPLYKAAPNRKKDSPNLYSAEAAKLVNDFVRYRLVPAETLTAAEMRRLRRIEKDEERDLDKVDLQQHVICSGYAGTGKTLLGLQMALRKQVPTLFICYNKVLASDIRRLTSLSDLFVDLVFEALDIFQLLSDCERRLCIHPERWDKTKENWEQYETRRILKLIEHDFERGARLRSEWGLLIIDEAQDISEASWTLIDYLVGSNTVLFVIEGKNQLLYREKPHEYLSEGLPSIVPPQNQRKKRRVFRTTSETFLLGQLFVESYPSLDKAQNLWTKTLQPRYLEARKRETQSEFDFELTRKNGEAPSVLEVSLKDPAAVIRLIAQSIRSAVEKFSLSDDGTPSDILILLPSHRRIQHGLRLPLEHVAKRGSNTSTIPRKRFAGSHIRRTRCESRPSIVQEESKDSTP